LIIVFDDYHVIESQEIDQALTFVLDHLPPQMRLVIASRTDPALNLSRLRARGQLIELRANDLRFTTDEAAAFLQQVVHLPISADDIRMLKDRTEGWITGLQLAAVAMQSLDQPEQIAGFIDSFGGSHRHIIDYLVDEVLDQQTPPVQAFLLQTSILDQLTAPLCNAVTDRENSQTILEQLEAANLFVVPLDGERRWYRYHRLFADMLVYRLRRSLPDRIPELYRLASLWYEREGYPGDAFRYAREAGDIDLAVGILEYHWYEIFYRGEQIKLRRWLDSLGPEYTKNSAALSMAYCWICTLTDAIDAIPGHIQDIRKVMKGETERDIQQLSEFTELPSLVETMEATIALDNRQAKKAREHARKAIALIPDNRGPVHQGLLHAAASYRLARAHRQLGELDQACLIMLEVLERLKASKNYLGTARTVSQIVSMYKESDKPQEAIQVCKDTIAYIQEHHWDQIPPCGLVYVLLANLQADSGDFANAEKNMEIGRELGERVKLQSILDLANRVKEKLGNISPSPQPLVEPLSERELQVLHLIAQGLSNREISERLFVALSTIKGHNQNIFSKLQVKRRTEAVVRARELGLVLFQALVDGYFLASESLVYPSIIP
jgi:LuxR family maltose regulon positive regulatory protein